LNRSERLAFCSLIAFALATWDTSPNRSTRFLMSSVKTGAVDLPAALPVFF